MRGKKRAEEQAARQAEKTAKDEHRRQEDLRTYKALMKVRGRGGQHPLCIVFEAFEPLPAGACSHSCLYAVAALSLMVLLTGCAFQLCSCE